MTTPQQRPSPVSQFLVHQNREVAESFGRDPACYDSIRPRYHDAVIQRIVTASPGRRVLDVGCGTGTAARQFRAAGCEVLGVEPDARMAAFARRGGLDVDVATFEDWDPAGRMFDAVTAASAWHWVCPARSRNWWIGPGPPSTWSAEASLCVTPR